jgi:hypothetical protein
VARSSSDPTSPCRVVSALGHDLFIVRGLTHTIGERIRTAVRREGVRQTWTILQAVIVAVLAAIALIALRIKA